MVAILTFEWGKESSALVQEVIVAPVVRTSSTNNQCCGVATVCGRASKAGQSKRQVFLAPCILRREYSIAR